MKKILFSLLALCFFALPVQAQSFKYADIELPAGYQVAEGPIMEGENTHIMAFANPQGMDAMIVLIDESDDTLAEIQKDLQEEITKTQQDTKISTTENGIRLTDAGAVSADVAKIGKYLVAISYVDGTNAELEGIVKSLLTSMKAKQGK